jgi:large subunit ribosomal protein L28
MARRCETCGKRTEVGNRVARRGLAKAKGGVGIKTTSREKREFRPNLQRIRVMDGKTPVRMKVCVKCLKAGKVRKVLRKPKYVKPGAAGATGTA